MSQDARNRRWTDHHNAAAPAERDGYLSHLRQILAGTNRLRPTYQYDPNQLATQRGKDAVEKQYDWPRALPLLLAGA